MPVYGIFTCEMVVFSLLIGAFMDSLVLGVIILGSTGILIYTLFHRLYNPLPLVWSATVLGSLTVLLWASYIDAWLGTTFIAILSSFLTGVFCYLLNDRFFKKYQG